MHYMKNALFAFATLLLSMTVLSTSTQAANLRLNGAGIHYAVTEEIYIGALYLEAPASSAEEAINMAGAKRMEMHILAESWRSRSFATTWLQLISINNPLDEVNAMAAEVQAFSNILEDKLEFGDSIRVDLEPGQGIEITINGVPVAHIDNEAFFNLLLRSWLGKRSPSNDFTRNLLQISSDNADIISRFDVTLPEPGRKDAIALWASAKAMAPAGTAAVAQAAKPAVSTPKPTVAAAPKPAATAPKPAAPAVEAAVPEAEAPEPAPAATEPVVEKAPEPALVATEPEPVETKPAAAPKAEPEVAAKPAQATEPENPAVDVEALEKTYRAYILRDTYKKVRYPQRAASRNQEGEVVVEVTVNRDGTLAKSELKGKSYPALNNAAEDAVKEAAPYPAAPDDLPGDTFTFDIPIKFKIPR